MFLFLPVPFDVLDFSIHVDYSVQHTIKYQCHREPSEVQRVGKEQSDVPHDGCEVVTGSKEGKNHNNQQDGEVQQVGFRNHFARKAN